MFLKRDQKEYVNCWGSGIAKREFLHSDDLGDASVFALENWDPSSDDAPLDDKGNPLCYLNVGTGKDLSIKDLAQKIALELDYQGSIEWDKSKPDGTLRKQLDAERIINLGWKSKISFENGIKNTVNIFIEGIKNKTLRF